MAKKWKHGIRIAVLEERSRGERTVRKQQAKEYQRRLAELNHAHAQAEERQAHYVSMDKFDGFVGEMNQWRAKVADEMAQLRGRSKGFGDMVGWLVAAAGLGAAVAMYFK